jgi:hypothetical protein
VFLGKIMLAKLPHVYEIAIEDEDFGLDRPQILEEFTGMTAVSAEVDIGDDDHI